MYTGNIASGSFADPAGAPACWRKLRAAGRADLKYSFGRGFIGCAGEERGRMRSGGACGEAGNWVGGVVGRENGVVW